MLSLFRTNQIAFNLLLLLYLVGLRLHYFLYPSPSKISEYPIFPASISAYLEQPILQGVVVVLLIFVQAFLINNLAMKHRLFNESTLFPGLFYILATSVLTDFFPLSTILFGNFFLIIGLDNLLSTYKQHQCADKIFNTGFWIGIASLFYASFAFFFLLALVGLSFLRAIKWREVMMMFLGFAVPFFVLGTWYFWNDQLPQFWKTFIADQLSFLNFQYERSPVFLAKIGGILLLFLLAFFHGYEFKKSNQIRTNIQVLYLALIVSGMTFIFQPEVTIVHFLIMMVPLSFFLAARFLSFSTTFAELAHVILLILIVFFQYQGFERFLG